MEVDAAATDFISPSVASPAATPPINDLTAAESEMIQHIVHENRAFFRSQQINDPDLNDSERTQIVAATLRSGHKKFLYRFGQHIKADHLPYFVDACRQQPVDDVYEIKFLLRDIRKRLQNRQRDVRNRRFAAMNRMINDDADPYFTEEEMMNRQPLLYEQLVGQYMTDSEKKQRDNFDPDSEFSGVLLDGIAKKHFQEQLKKEQHDEEVAEERVEYDTDDDEDHQSNESDSSTNPTNDVHEGGINIDDKYYPQTPPSFKRHWGDFDDEDAAVPLPSVDTPSCSRPPVTVSISGPTTPVVKKSKQQIYVTADEKELLREEFVGIMQANFLSGLDKDFDYTTVDDNADYDDINQQAQDEEDKYFDEDDEDDDDDNDDNGADEPVASDSDDELDKYMETLK